MSQSLVFDIETEPLPDEILLQTFVPPEPLKPPGEFDPDEVKLGNTKAQDKIAQKIEDARKKHVLAVREHQNKEQSRQFEALDKFREKASLSVFTSKVCAIGIMGSDGLHDIWDATDEAEAIRMLWRSFERVFSNRGIVVGHCIHTFDLPYLVRRSWLLDVSIPDGVLPAPGVPYWPNHFVDLNSRWNTGTRDKTGTLDEIGKYFGLGGKNEEVEGKNFYRLWRSEKPEERQAARNYLYRDLELALKIANRIHVL